MGGSDGGAGLLLRNCIAVDQVEDPEAAVDGILQRCAPHKLMELFSIPAYASTEQFLTNLAVKRFMVTKGGVPDRAKAARTVLQEWNSGKIPFFVMPPDLVMGKDGEAMDEGGGALRKDAKDVGTAQIISEWSKVSVSVCVLTLPPLFPQVDCQWLSPIPMSCRVTPL